MPFSPVPFSPVPFSPVPFSPAPFSLVVPFSPVPFSPEPFSLAPLPFSVVVLSSRSSSVGSKSIGIITGSTQIPNVVAFQPKQLPWRT
eukprot:15450820-Alexandrium_andersonii.AAC.1